MRLFETPVKSHIADVYDKTGKIVVYDTKSIDTETNMFKTLYTIYGTLDTVDDLDIEQLQQLGCESPQLYNPQESKPIEIGGVWIG